MKNVISLAVSTLLMATPHSLATTLFVRQASPNPVPPFTNWATAASDIQQAVAAAAAGDEVVVTNGIYGSVNADKPVLLRSVNGPQVTIIDASGRSRCTQLTNGSSLAGISLRHGMANDFGGGLFCSSSNIFITNCIISGNTAHSYSNGVVRGEGGGVYGGTLYNCLITSNAASVAGGGASGSTLYNCTVTANRANRFGGGIHRSTAINSIVYFNTAIMPYENHHLALLDHCCTKPMPTNGVANLPIPPEFVNLSKGDLRLLGTSRCIDAGDNRNVVTAFDLAGHPRVMRGTVDLGAYEFQGTNAMVFYAWVQHHGVVIDGTEDYLDPDGDGMNNWQEWFCGTCPTNTLKVLRMVSAVREGAAVAVRWESVPGKSYFVERGTNPTSEFNRVAADLQASMGDTTVYTDRNLPGPGPFFYRAGLEDMHGGGKVVCLPVKSSSAGKD
jgi:hypothetical protein